MVSPSGSGSRGVRDVVYQGLQELENAPSYGDVEWFVAFMVALMEQGSRACFNEPLNKIKAWAFSINS